MKLNEETKRLLSKLPTGNVADNNPNGAVMDSGIMAVNPSLHMIGRAFTVRCKGGDNLALHRGLYEASSGDVLVYDCEGYMHGGHFGDMMASAAREKDRCAASTARRSRPMARVSAGRRPDRNKLSAKRLIRLLGRASASREPLAERDFMVKRPWRVSAWSVKTISGRSVRLTLWTETGGRGAASRVVSLLPPMGRMSQLAAVES